MSIQRLSIPSHSIPRDLISSSDDSDNYSSCTRKKTSLKIPTNTMDTDIDADIDLLTNNLVDPIHYNSIPKNSKITYIKHSGKKIQNKYFKGYDSLSESILIGFYIHDKRNYTEKISNIKQLFTTSKIDGGGTKEEILKGTIELDKSQWKNLNRDTIISYEKKDKEWIYKAKFNAFVKSSKDQSTRLSMTSEKGFSFVVNPNNILKMYRHISSNDKTLTFILQTLKQLEQKFMIIEKKVKQLDNRLDNIEKRIRK